MRACDPSQSARATLESSFAPFSSSLLLNSCFLSCLFSFLITAIINGGVQWSQSRFIRRLLFGGLFLFLSAAAGLASPAGGAGGKEGKNAMIISCFPSSYLPTTKYYRHRGLPVRTLSGGNRGSPVLSRHSAREPSTMKRSTRRGAK